MKCVGDIRAGDIRFNATHGRSDIGFVGEWQV